MLKLIVPILLVISFSAAATSQGPTAPDQTAGMINGRYCSRMSEVEKMRWLHGYTDGLRVAAALAHGEPCVTQANKVFDFYPRQLSFAEIMKATDHFYQDTPENAPVPVTGAVRYVTLKAGGAPQSALETLAESFRKTSVTPETKP